MFSRDLIQPVQTLCELLDLIQAQPDQDRTAITFYRGAERGASLTYGEYLAAIHSWSAYLQGAVCRGCAARSSRAAPTRKEPTYGSGLQFCGGPA